MRASPVKVIILMVVVTGCSASTPGDRDAQSVVDQISRRVPSAHKTVVISAVNDPERLIGMSSTYTSKTEFLDTRLARRIDTPDGVPAGGAVEVFADEWSAMARQVSLYKATRAGPADSEYDYLAGSTLLRLSRDMTTDQASEYERALHDVSVQ